MVRINPQHFEKIAQNENISAMVHGGKVMSHQKLKYWIELAMDYNLIAPLSKKKKK